MPEAFVPLLVVEVHDLPQTPGPADNLFAESGRRLLSGHRSCVEVERHCQAATNLRPVLQTAFPRYRHSRLGSFQSFGRIAYEYDHIRPLPRRAVRRLVRGVLPALVE